MKQETKQSDINYAELIAASKSLGTTDISKVRHASGGIAVKICYEVLKANPDKWFTSGDIASISDAVDRKKFHNALWFNTSQNKDCKNPMFEYVRGGLFRFLAVDSSSAKTSKK